MPSPPKKGSDRKEADRRGGAVALANGLLAAPPRVINVGLEIFAQDLAGQGIPVVHVQWTPPAGGNPHLARLLDKLQS